MKKLYEFEEDYGQFYAPAATIKVGGRDLVRDLHLTITSTTVELKLNAAGRFSFTVASAFDWQRREFLGKPGLEPIDLLELFAFGAQVEVWLGYGRPVPLPLITGIVTEISTSFAETGTPALTIGGYDALYPLGVGRSSAHWDDKRPSDAVREVGGRHSLRVNITASDRVEPRLDQSRESDLAFITRMARQTRSIFYVRDASLCFGPRRNTSAAIADIAWGEGLSSFSPTANLAKQVTEVQVHGWSATRGEAVVGSARRGDVQGVEGGSRSGPETIGRALSVTPVLAISAAVHSQQEADDRARAILEERGQDFVTGDGECIGLPDLLPDTNIQVSGVGRAFSSIYYVTETTHTLDSKGYRSRFNVQEPGTPIQDNSR